MTRSVLLILLLTTLASAAEKPAKTEARDRDIALKIIAMERDALERGAKGAVDAFVDISDPDVVYFDPFIERRIDGLAALKDYYHKGAKPPAEQFDIELINPNVRVLGDVAVLTFNYKSVGRSTGHVERWNCTEVYRQTAQGWRIVQTHWSLTKPQLAAAR